MSVIPLYSYKGFQEETSRTLTYDEFKQIFEILQEIGQGDWGTVFKVLNKLDNEVVAMKMVASTDSNVINTSDVESYTIELLDENFSKYTDNIIKVKNFGSAPIELIDELGLTVVSSYGRYGDDEEEEENTVSPQIVFFTMPLLGYDPKDTSEFTNNDYRDIMFELIMTLSLLNKNGYSHDDINVGNIGFMQVSYKRVYTINGIQYVVSSHHMPVIIDWAPYEGTRLPSEPKDDLSRLAFYYARMGNFELPRNVYDILSTTGIQIHTKGMNALQSLYFAPLKDEQIALGDMVKYFEPINL